MATVNFETKEITAKVVYFGPQETGCNQLVRNVYVALGREHTSELLHFAEEGSSYSWFFHHRDRAPQDINGCGVRYEVYSLPREVSSATHRSEVLNDADLFVVLVDARKEYEANNLDTLVNLEQGLGALGRELAKTVILLKVTHGESPHSRPAEEVAYSVNPHGFGVLGYATSSSEQRLRLHQEVLAELLDQIRANLADPDSSPICLTPVSAKPRHAQGILGEHLRAFADANESVLSSFDHPASTPEDFDTLDSTARVVLPFEVESCPDHQPIQVISAAVDRGHVHLDLVLDNPEGGDPQRAHLVLMHQPSGYSGSDGGAQSTSDDLDPVTETIPMTIEISRPKPGAFQDAKLSFGIIVLISGILLGLGLGFLLWY
jgi:hypothetical protein